MSLEILLFIAIGGFVVGLILNLAKKAQTPSALGESEDPHWTPERKQKHKASQERKKASQERKQKHIEQQTLLPGEVALNYLWARREAVAKERASNNERVKEEQKRLEDRLEYFGGWERHKDLPLDKALEFGVPQQKCFVYKLKVGGLDYIGFTTQEPRKRLEQHLKSAKQNSKHLVHVQLRRFGFIHDFEIISEHENEVLGLVAEISNIKKYTPELNTSIGGEGNTFKVFEKESLLGEVIFFVAKNDNDIT